MDLIKTLNWRYATKKYTNRKIDEDKIDLILESINLTASSCGLQPYRIISVNDSELQTKLGADSFNGQIAECSHLLVFAALNDVDSEYISEYVSMMEQQRELPAGSMNDYKDNLIGYFGSLNSEQKLIWADKQAYIALGTALIAAAELKIDATPMEGFTPGVFDELLGLKEKGLHSTVILALGYREETNDFLSNLKKVRLPINEFTTKVN